MNLRVIASVVLVAVGIGVMYAIDGLLGLFLGSLVFVAALALWTLPSNIFHRNQNRLDPRQERMSNVLLGAGIGMIAGVVAAILLPPPWFWVAAVGILAVFAIWWFRQP